MGGLVLHAGQPAPDHRDRVIHSLEAENTTLKKELRQAREDLTRAQAEAGRAIQELRRVLSPFRQALMMVFGEMDAIAPEQAGVDAPVDSKTSAVWKSWKEKMPGSTAKIIDALLLHGELDTQQLAIAVGLHRTTIPALIYKLNQAGLINKNGRRFSLKQL